MQLRWCYYHLCFSHTAGSYSGLSPKICTIDMAEPAGPSNETEFLLWKLVAHATHQANKQGFREPLSFPCGDSIKPPSQPCLPPKSHHQPEIRPPKLQATGTNRICGLRIGSCNSSSSSSSSSLRDSDCTSGRDRSDVCINVIV